MKKYAFFLSLLMAIIELQAQDYQITFAATGASATVDTVKVENLTQGKSISISGADVLHLVATNTGLNPMSDIDNTLRIYPNPMTGNSTIDFTATSPGLANIELFDITGKSVITTHITLTIGTHSFKVSGLSSGIYTLRIHSQAYSYAGKLVSNGAPGLGVKLSYNGYIVIPVTSKKLKSANAEKVMQYTTGDRLKITGTSGKYSTVITDIPTQSKTITFTLFGCTDADGNNYPVVKIGTQLWMAENLKNTKYRNGDTIPNVTSNGQWATLNTGANCNYNNTPGNNGAHGRLYNWHAVQDSRNIAPIGWHIPTDAEWTILTNYLGGESVAGGKLKETGTIHWKSPNTGATDETGFTACPDGKRNQSGTFDLIENNGYWWSSSGYYTAAWYRSVNCDGSNVVRDNMLSKSYGFSVRCLLDSLVSKAVVPSIITTATSEVTSVSAISGGNITTDGGAAITVSGLCWNTTGNPTTANNKTNEGKGPGSFTSKLTNLNANNTYYIRAYATNSVGTAYGNQIFFTTPHGLATVSTLAVTGIASISATSGGNINNDGGSAIITRGVCWNTTGNPTTADIKTSEGIGKGSFTINLTNLSRNTPYSIRAYATNSDGTAYGNQVIFFTTTGLATLSTSAVTGITSISAISGGTVTSEGEGPVTSRGICYSTFQTPTISDSIMTMSSGTGVFNDTLTGLRANTTYYVRVFATNNIGTGYGNRVLFKTAIAAVSDIDGNVYHTVPIGTQVWLVENLKTTKNNDGSNIPNVTDNTTWSNLTSPSYCWYDNDAANKNTFGALYNWHTVNTGKLCPTGWHVPTDAEWVTLTNYLGGNSIAGGKLKESGTSHWENPNAGAANEYGFTALPGGFRSNNGASGNMGYNGTWWSSSGNSTAGAWSRGLGNISSGISRDSLGKGNGVSVRCIMDENPIDYKNITNRRLYYLCKVWGFAKYYHTEIAKGPGTINWDNQLLIAIPLVKAANSDAEYNAAVLQMLNSAGHMGTSLTSLPLVPDSLNLNLDLKWMDNIIFSSEITTILKEILNKFRPQSNYYVGQAYTDGYPTFDKDRQYNPGMDYPSEEIRLLGLFRYWNIINYFYPYKFIMDQNWDSTLVEFIPKIVNSMDALSFHLNFAQLTTRINDSHAFFGSEIFDNWIGMNCAPFEVRFIQNETVITRVLPGITDIHRGDIIKEIDGYNIYTLRDSLRKYCFGSNSAYIESILNRYIKNGDSGNFQLKVYDGVNMINKTLSRVSGNCGALSPNLSGRSWTDTIIDNNCNLGIVDMGRLQKTYVSNMFSALWNTDAIIFDIRNYPQETLSNLVDYLFPGPIEVANLTAPDITYPGRLYWQYENVGLGTSNPYKGKIIILFDERTISQAEFTCMGLEQFPGAIKIGNTTAGADGPNIAVYLPGNISTNFTSMGVFYPDYKQTQRIGIIPDYEVHPTIQGIREGRDEVMEFAFKCALLNIKK